MKSLNTFINESSNKNIIIDEKFLNSLSNWCSIDIYNEKNGTKDYEKQTFLKLNGEWKHQQEKQVIKSSEVLEMINDAINGILNGESIRLTIEKSNM